MADDLQLSEEMNSWTDAELVGFFESGGVARPNRAAGLATRTHDSPIRVLCLHGGGTNRKVMEHQTALLRSTMGPAASFDFLEGGRPWNDAEVEPVVRRMFGDGPYYGWYGVEHDGPKSEATGLAALMSYIGLLEDIDNVKFTYSDVELAIAKLETHVAGHGPFDALIGFSQGAIVATLATAIALERQQLGQGLGPPWKRVVLICGMPPRDSRYISRFFGAAPLNFPATLVFGKRDPFNRYGQRLKDCFLHPMVMEHDEGHKFPSSQDFSKQLAEHILSVL